MLSESEIRLLVDVRTVPRSRHNPQFNRETLPGPLGLAGIRYQHEPGLGGLRRPRPDSRNLAWRNSLFRGFADYMETPEFEQALEQLIALAKALPTAIMCAEAVPWRCHRTLIADAATVRGVQVEHILGAGRTQEHRMTPFAVVQRLRVGYPLESAPINPQAGSGTESEGGSVAATEASLSLQRNDDQDQTRL